MSVSDDARTPPLSSPHGQSEGEGLRQPPWTWDELILACALVYRNGWREVKRTDQRAIELSDLLQALPIHPPEIRGENFRSDSSVQRKTADLATAHPDYPGKTTKGGSLTREVVEEFIRRPEAMLAAADTVREAIFSGDPELLQSISRPAVDEPDISASEGRLIERIRLHRERNPKLRAAKIRKVLTSGSSLACEVCDFNFSTFYGQHGSGYVEIHHTTPLHESGETETRLEDLALLCANCHKMSHRRLKKSGTWPTVAELREVVAAAKQHP
ncbi:HNH endonuclease [Actinomadura parmotrematis]|uniref:HNH endonuclease n=1 Tax=Actinomadura parmotrematis TaxID=2864039 RepID=A0ABS7G2N2_9ACTN|nr:HNH endonuclease [Actinomadura parmotrematis]MBW8485903.1 HNH endonuclease [Actinomadura parmotrematis]